MIRSRERVSGERTVGPNTRTDPRHALAGQAMGRMLGAVSLPRRFGSSEPGRPNVVPRPSRYAWSARNAVASRATLLCHGVWARNSCRLPDGGQWPLRGRDEREARSASGPQARGRRTAAASADPGAARLDLPTDGLAVLGTPGLVLVARALRRLRSSLLPTDRRVGRVETAGALEV